MKASANHRFNVDQAVVYDDDLFIVVGILWNEGRLLYRLRPVGSTDAGVIAAQETSLRPANDTDICKEMEKHRQAIAHLEWILSRTERISC